MDLTEKGRIDEHGNKYSLSLSEESFYSLYGVCHVTGMLSACANPIIYGYLNENFSREFKNIFSAMSRVPSAFRRLRWSKH